MRVELVIAPEAELDIAEAYVWYEGQSRTGGGVLEFGRCVSGKHPAPTRDAPCRSRGLPSLPYTSLSIRRVLRAVGGDGHDLRRISFLSRPGQMAPAPSLTRGRIPASAYAAVTVTSRSTGSSSAPTSSPSSGSLPM